MKLGLVQYSPEFEYPEENILKIENLISSMGSKADLLIFPEMTLTGYTMNSMKFGEEIDGIGTKYFINLSSRIKTDLFAGIIELDDNTAFNSLVHFDSYGLIRARYRKIHPYSNAGEDKNYGAGEETVITKIDQIKIGLSICYDLRFPELYRLYAKNNVEILVDIASWPVQRIEHWKTLLQARAIENQCFMVGVNRTGADQYGKYNGCSAVFDPMGKEIIIGQDSEKIIEVEIDLDKVKEVRAKLPFLQDIKLI
jgi:predicted amidohydrolase